MWCIRKTDQKTYEGLMRQYGLPPHIIKDYGENVMVEFPSFIMQTWVQAGYWYGSCE